VTDPWWDAYERRVRNREYAALIERAKKLRPSGPPPVSVSPEEQRRSTARALSGLIAAKMVRDNRPAVY
jgi:hypothetical protein